MEKKDQSLITVKSFVSAVLIILALMIGTYALTIALPGENLPVWKFLLAPFLVLGAEGSATIIAVIIFLLVVGGVFNCLGESGLMNYMLHTLIAKFSKVRYKLMAILILFFMGMGSLIGSFEEVIPIAPIVVILATGLGWDQETGLAMSLLAAGCGFAAGVANPFTIGFAQNLAGLPLFSGIWLRALAFILIFILLYTCVRTHAKKIETEVVLSKDGITFHYEEKKNKGLKVFAIIFGIGILLVFASVFLTFLQDYTLIIVAFTFLTAGLASVMVSGMRGKTLRKSFWDGLIGIAPSVLMILMASSIRYILVESNSLGYILDWAKDVAGGMSKIGIILFIYLFCLVMNFFIPSGSAKALLLIPIIVPIAEVFGISAQLCIVAFAFGDGFSNVFYPTNPGLLVALGLSDISYKDWAKYSLPFQVLNLVLTCGILLLGLSVGY